MNIGLELRLYDALGLEVRPIEEALTVKRLRAQGSQCSYPLRVEQRHVITHQTAPVVHDQGVLVVAQGPRETVDVRRQIEDPVLVYLRRAVRSSVTALIWRGDAPPGCDEWIDLLRAGRFVKSSNR